MSQPSLATRLIGRLATLIAALLLGGWGVDYVADSFGYQSHAFCTLVSPVIVTAHQIGVTMACVGVLIWAVSFGRSDRGLALALGGFLLFALPLALPHYLGVTCLL